MRFTVWMLSWCLGIAALCGADTVLWKQDFAAGKPGSALPAPWGRYGGAQPAPAFVSGGLRIVDDSEKAETGIVRRFPLKGPGFARITVEVEALPGRKLAGAFIQLRFFPADKFVQVPLEKKSVIAPVPAGTNAAQIFVYTHAWPKPAFLLKSVTAEFSATPFPVPKPDPRKEPGVLTDMKRELYIPTPLVKDGKPAAVIAVPEQYRDLAAAINAAVKAKTGVELPVVSDADFARMRELETNLIAPGSRDDSLTVARLYGFHYALIDACHPGPRGNELRSVHNPFGDGHNVILAGGSAPAGTRAAVEKLVREIGKLPAGKNLSLGFLMDVTLDPAKKVPDVSDHAKIWEGSRGYGERGTFAWNQLSKNLALFYVTGDTKFAKEFLRLAFPTPEVAKELLRRDDEAFWDPKRPLETPYHYRALQIILYWDLVEEHPFFDGVREKITAALYEQNAPKARSGTGTFGLRAPVVQTGNRHAAWEALATWGIARYFWKNYRTKDGEDGLKAAEYALGGARRSMTLEAGSLFWFNTFMEPVINYLVLTGADEARGLESMKSYGEALMSLCSGHEDWTTSSCAFNMLSKLAWLNDDEAPMTILRQAVADPLEFRLGQSWYTAKPYRHDFFRDSQGIVFRPNFDGRHMACYREKYAESKYEDLAQYLSYRRGDDMLLMDTKYEQGRNPFHNNAVIRLTLNGMPILAGHYNTMQIFCDGISSGRAGFLTDFRNGYGRLDEAVTVDGTVYDGNDHDWNRVLVLRDKRWLLAVDSVTARRDMAQSVVNLMVQRAGGNTQKILPNGDIAFTRAPARRAGTNPDIFAQYVGRDLASQIDHSGRYFSGYLDCAGIQGLKVGEPVPIRFSVPKSGPAELRMLFIGHEGSRGLIDVLLDGKKIHEKFDHTAPGYRQQSLDLGVHELAAGAHTLTLVPVTLPGGTGVITLNELMVVRPGANIRREQQTAAASCALPAVPEVEPVSVSAGGVGEAAAFRFTHPAKKGETFRVVSLTRLGRPADTASAAQVGNEVALLLPEPALLTLRDEGFFLNSSDFVFGYRVDMPELSGVKGLATFEYHPATGKRTVRAADGKCVTDTVKLAVPELPEVKIRAMLAAKPRPKADGAKFAAPELEPAWKLQGAGFPGAIHRFTRQGKQYFLLANGTRVRLCDFSGKVLWDMDAGAPVGALYYWPGADLCLSGARDEHLIARDFSGKERWRFTSEMSQELVESVKFYWFKRALPGITHIFSAELGGRDLLFLGSTGTVEALGKEGKLVGRVWGDWGYTSGSLVLPGEIRVYRHAGADPNVRELRMQNGKLVSVNRGMTSDIRGGYMGRFGFSMVGRYGMLAAKLAPDRDVQTVETLNGVHNRLMIRDLKGKIRYEADLGPGFVASAGQYGQDARAWRNVRGLAVSAPDASGKRTIVLAFNRKFAAGFDPELKVKWMLPLPVQPVRLLGIDGERFALACGNGLVLILDRDGKVTAQVRTTKFPAELATDGKVLVVADERGYVTAFTLPAR